MVKMLKVMQIVSSTLVYVINIIHILSIRAKMEMEAFNSKIVDFPK